VSTTSYPYHHNSIQTPKGGKVFVAAIEGNTLPFFGTQFHPEKPEFFPNSGKGHNRSHIPKTAAANATGLYLARFFINQTAPYA
jgi:hypothetical protein